MSSRPHYIEEAKALSLTRGVCSACGAPWPKGANACRCGATGRDALVVAPVIGELADSVIHCAERAEAAETLAQIHREERDACAAEVLRLRAVIDGRTVPPTDAELDAHEAAGGTWTCATAGEWIFSDAGMDAEAARELRSVLAVNSWAKPRWWAHDAENRPCAWPVTPAVPS